MNKYSQHSVIEQKIDKLKEYRACKEKHVYTLDESKQDGNVGHCYSRYYYYHCPYCHKFHRASTFLEKASSLEGIFEKKFSKTKETLLQKDKKEKVIPQIDFESLPIGITLKLTPQASKNIKSGIPMSVINVDLENRIVEVSCSAQVIITMPSPIEDHYNEYCDPIIYLSKADLLDYLMGNKEYPGKRRNNNRSKFCYKNVFYKRTTNTYTETILIPFECFKE